MAITGSESRLSIGNFSKLSRVSIKALRLYDQLGLLKPIVVDPDTSYRYYAAVQLSQLNRILALKDLGFSLEQVAQVLSNQISVEQLRGMLRLRQANLQQTIATERARLERVEARLQQIEQENQAMSIYEVVLKPIAPMQVVSIRDTIENYSAIGQLFTELCDYLKQQSAKPSPYCVAIWHDEGFKPQNVDGEAVVPIDTVVPETERVRIYELPPVETAACLVHHGSYKQFDRAYAAMLAWIDSSGYQIVGSNREFYIYGGSEQGNEKYITELQFPVAKR